MKNYLKLVIRQIYASPNKAATSIPGKITTQEIEVFDTDVPHWQLHARDVLKHMVELARASEKKEGRGKVHVSISATNPNAFHGLIPKGVTIQRIGAIV